MNNQYKKNQIRTVSQIQFHTTTKMDSFSVSIIGSDGFVFLIKNIPMCKAGIFNIPCDFYTKTGTRYDEKVHSEPDVCTKLDLTDDDNAFLKGMKIKW